MAYDIILVPGCETLRESTLERLEAFAAAGGKLVFLGDAPSLIDAKPDPRGVDLADRAILLPFNRVSVLAAVEEVREVEIRNSNGMLSGNLLHQLRTDGDDRWLFIAHGSEPYNKDISNRQDIRITLRGTWTPTLYDTLTGDIRPVPYTTANGMTVIEWGLYDYDSLLFKLSPAEEGSAYAAPAAANTESCVLPIPNALPFTLHEPNVLLLDMAEFSLDGEDYAPAEELLRADNACRRRLGWPSREGRVAQPWTVAPEPIEHHIRLRFTIRSEIDLMGTELALEDAETAKILLDGADVPSTVTGWYVDKSIKKVAMPPIAAGEHKLEITLPFGRRTNVEWCYLLGNFGVKVCGREATVISLPEKLGFGDIVPQGLPFYGGKLTYHTELDTKGGALTLRVPHYRAAVMAVHLDGEKIADLAYPPYRLGLGKPAAGRHQLDIDIFVSRQNAFGPLHLSNSRAEWIGPNAWRTGGDSWTYEYNFFREGITSVFEVKEEK